MPKDYETLVQNLRRAICDGPGKLDCATRLAVMDGGEMPEPVRVFAEKVRFGAWDIADSDIEALTKAGYTEDQIFEITIAAAVGASLRRRDAGMRALRGGK